MHPSTSRIIAQIVNPPGGVAPEREVQASTAMTIEQIIRPRGVYTGVERRAQGALLAEVITPPQPAPGA